MTPKNPRSPLCSCGGLISVTKEKCYMAGQECGAERGWDYLAKCDGCKTQLFGYTEEAAIKRVRDRSEREKEK